MRPLAAFRQEFPHRELAPLALRFAERFPGTAFLDAGGPAEAGSCGRFAVLGWRPSRTLAFPAGRRGAVEAIRKLLGPTRMAPDPESPAPFRGGWIGWIGYDVGRDIERLPERNPPRPSVPEFVLAEYEALLVEDRRDRRLFVTGACDPHEGPSRLLARQAEALEHFAAMDAEGPAEPVPVAAATGVRALTTRDEYLRRAERVLSWIRSGDIFQANLSQEFAGHLSVTLAECYRRLRAASPAPYGCFLDLEGPAVLSVSPELFLERRGGRIVTRPIKGTRRRSPDPAEDARQHDDLEASEKDRAELAMIVDLLRNDLGRVALTGTVRVERERELTAHPSVHHASATVSAEVAPTVHAADVIRAAMPGGSITGAPKIRAMEILEELEDGRRGPYCGAAGWFGHDGDFVLNILIRTLVCDRAPGGGGGRVSFRVGGGIVADSSPGAEHEETLVKAAALLDALGPRGAAPR
ncbi:MAG: Aminodeoxychorismate synthase component 1 [Planctomycetes bacterium]|nr:Aminodeoxychorismate synthase component 1 [Planctomycetota bacterium]